MNSFSQQPVSVLIESTAMLGRMTENPSMLTALRKLEELGSRKKHDEYRVNCVCSTRWDIALQLAHTWDEPSKALCGNLCALSQLSEEIDDDELVSATDDLVEAFLRMSERMSYCKFALRESF